MRYAILVALLGCGAPTAPAPTHAPSTPASPAPSGPTPSPNGPAPPSAPAGPPLATTIVFSIASYGPAADGYSPPRAEWEPRQPIQLIRVECAPGRSPRAKATEPVPVATGDAPPQPKLVCRSGWSRALGKNLASNISTFSTANAQYDRLEKCYALRDVGARKPLLDAIVGAMFESGGHPPPLDKTLIAAANGKPLVVAIHSVQKVAVYEHCQQLDCEMDPKRKPRFIRFDELEELQLIAADGTSTRSLYVPGEKSSAAMTLLDDGATPELVAEAKAGRWSAAATLAATRVADTRGASDVTHGIALANLALAQTFTGDRAALRETVDAFRALKLSTDRQDLAAARVTIDQADEYAKGMVYLGADPCAPPKKP